VLGEGLLKSPFSLTEVRVLYELAHRARPTAAELCKELGLDPGYLSRILRKFDKSGLIQKAASEVDARQVFLGLTRKGRGQFEILNKRSHDEVAKVLRGLSAGAQRRLLEAMDTLEDVLGVQNNRKTPYLLRPFQPGDMGWVVYRHGVLYSQEFGYDEHFEALVASIVSEFVRHYDGKRERCWIAERDGEIVGSVFLVKKSQTVAQLRLLLVEPTARGMGIGKRLVAECVRFARQARYKKITLWTQSELKAARRVYEHAEFRLVDEKSHHSWGRDLVAQTWDLSL
jgi:DNA-binding MarR family transcriptional regulator/N-acetylglutamate synthase-like GNAT family acetyltransferase